MNREQQRAENRAKYPLTAAMIDKLMLYGFSACKLIYSDENGGIGKKPPEVRLEHVPRYNYLIGEEIK